MMQEHKMAFAGKKSLIGCQVDEVDAAETPLRMTNRTAMRRSVKIMVWVGGVCCLVLALVRAGGSAHTDADNPAQSLQELFSAALGSGALPRPPATPITPADRSIPALTSQADATCEAAALKLIAHPETDTAMVRRVLRQTPSPRARAVAAIGLGRRKDLESLDDLVDALADRSLVVRTRSIWAIRRILHNPYLHFQPDAPASIRDSQLKALRRECAFAKKAYAIRKWYADRGLFPGTRGPDGRPLCPLVLERSPRPAAATGKADRP